MVDMDRKRDGQESLLIIQQAKGQTCGRSNNDVYSSRGLVVSTMQ